MNSDPKHPKSGWLHRYLEVSLRAAAAVAAVLGISLKIGAADANAAPAQKDAQRESGRADSHKPAADEKSGSLNALLQGTWSAPPQLGNRPSEMEAGIPSAEQKKPKFDDLGFISHINSGFNDFADR